MSSFYDDASLVVIPSGYKTSKVYVEKPTDGSGDLAFTRTGDTATRVNSAGLIEKVRTNLITYSQDFSNAAWVTNNSTKTTSQTDPNSGTTAVKIVSTANVNSGIYQTKTSSSTIRTASLWMKGEVGGEVVEYGDATNRATATLTTSWVRYSFAATDASAFFVIYNQISSPVIQTWYVAFVQYENGDIATDYIPTTTAAVSVGPVANVPRLDYLGSTCPRLLLEPQRTNLMTYSEQFSNANWFKYQATITSNSTTSPDGYTNADTIADSAVNDVHIAYQNTAFTAGTYTVSCYAKANTLSHAFLQIYDGTNFYASGIFNLTNGTVSGAGSITSAGNGWYRLSLTATVATGAGFSYVGTSNGSSVSYAGSGQSIYIWGYQTEAGAYATSYIPTLAATATRGADACSKTGISSLLNSSQGTIFLEVERIGPSGDSTENLIFISDTSVNNFVNIIFDTSTSRYRAQVREGGVTTGLVNATSAYTGSIKIAMAYAANDLVLYINGVQQGIDTSVTIPSATFNSLGLGGVFDGTYFDRFRGDYSQSLLFKTRLTNAQLAELTTL